MEFGVPMQNEMPMTTGRLKLKPEVEFQYGGSSFSQTGSSYNSAVDEISLYIKRGKVSVRNVRP